MVYDKADFRIAIIIIGIEEEWNEPTFATFIELIKGSHATKPVPYKKNTLRATMDH